MRVCARCGCEDATVIREGQKDFAGREIVEHRVTIELRYIKKREDITPWLRTRGWKFREHLGRPAMERLVCRDCLNQSAVVTRDFERKKRADMRPANSDGYYLNLCEGS